MVLPAGSFILICVLFIILLGLYSAMQASFTSLEQGISLFRIRRKTSLAQGTYKLVEKNSSVFFIASALGFWVFLLAFGIWFNQQLLISLQVNSGFLFLIFNLLLFVTIVFLAVILPMRLGRSFPALSWQIILIPYFIITVFLFPFAWFIDLLARKLNFSKSFKYSSLQLKPILEENNSNAMAQAALEGLDQEIYHNAMEFNTLRVRDCMIPRTEIVAVEKTEALEIVKQHFINSGHSKLLVYRENVDNVIGYIHLIDMYRKPSGIDKILMPITIAPESMTAGELLKQLIDKRRSMAVVVDEFGGTSGLITIEDLIEEIIGDIEDEYDIDDNTEKKISDTEYIFSARLEIDYLNENYNLNLPEGDYDTLGGLIFYVNQNIPKAREVITLRPFEFTILSTAKAKILDVKVKILTTE
jgi:CBS domain containing-hemolysin-like protein